MQNTQAAVETGETPAQSGEKKAAGDYGITYRIGPAKGLYEFSAGRLEWKEPQGENAHLDLVVTDAQSGQFIPGLHIVATLLDEHGGRAASNHLPMVWDAAQVYYGSNVEVPKSGEYLLQVHVFPATFPRADKELGKRFIADTHVQFERVRIDV